MGITVVYQQWALRLETIVLHCRWCNTRTRGNQVNRPLLLLNKDIDHKGIKDTWTCPTPEEVALRTKQLLEGIQAKNFNEKILLMQHINAILERLHIDERNLRRSNAIDYLHPNIHFETMTNITSKSIKRNRDHMKIYIDRK